MLCLRGTAEIGAELLRRKTEGGAASFRYRGKMEVDERKRKDEQQKTTYVLFLMFRVMAAAISEGFLFSYWHIINHLTAQRVASSLERQGFAHLDCICSSLQYARITRPKVFYCLCAEHPHACALNKKKKKDYFLAKVTFIL